MSKKVKILIAALIVLALLVGGYYGALFYRSRKAAELPSSYTPPPRLGNLESFELAKIETPAFTLEKSGDAWELVSLEGGIPGSGIELDQNEIQPLTYTLASFLTDRLVEENPADLSVYGLAEPFSRTIVTDTAGKKAEYILGGMNPSRTGYYIMEGGNPAVYTVSSYLAGNLNFSLDSIRQKALFSAATPETLTEFRLERLGSPRDSYTEGPIQITVKPERTEPYLSSAFFSHILNSPYLLPRGLHSESLQNLLNSFNELKIDTFVDDDPSSLEPYGLDRRLNQPIAVSLKTTDDSLDLLIGNEVEGKNYAKLADAPGVFTLAGMEGVVNLKPFNLIDKFIILLGIDTVERLSVSGGGGGFSADFQGKGEEAVFFLDGKKAEMKSFRTFYQAVIGILVDAEYPQTSGALPVGGAGGTGTPDDENVNIEFLLNEPAGGRASVTFVPYNRDFYAVQQNGTMEFLVSRSQIRNIYESLETVVYEE